MTLRRNLLAGLAGSILTGLVGLLVMPFYLRYLGLEAYGLVGFFAMLQAMLQLLDLGLAPAVNREVARASAQGGLSRAGSLIHTLAVAYWCTAALIACALFFLAPALAGHWLHPQGLSLHTVGSALRIMGLIAACRWPVALYSNALMGAQRLAVVSTVNTAAAIAGSLGAVAVLRFVAPTIQAFFIWQCLTALATVLIMRWAAWRAIGRSGAHSFEPGELRRIWRFSAKLSIVAVLTLILSQMDKLVLSNVLGLQQFGEYALACLAVSALNLVTIPMFNTFYPRFAKLVAGGEEARLLALYRLGGRLAASILLPIAMAVVLTAQDLVTLWTGDAALAARVALTVSLLAAGSALHGVMHIPYALQLAYGDTRLPLLISGAKVLFVTPVMIYLALHYGVVGGGVAWLLTHVLYLTLGTWATHRRLLIGAGATWLFREVGTPLLLSLLAGMAGRQAFQALVPSMPGRLAVAGLLAAVAVALSVLLSRALRQAAYEGLMAVKAAAP